MKIIKSTAAAKLAKSKFGPKAFVATDGKHYWVAIIHMGFWHCLGKGKTWTEALLSAGVQIPVEKIEETPTTSDGSVIM